MFRFADSVGYCFGGISRSIMNCILKKRKFLLLHVHGISKELARRIFLIIHSKLEKMRFIASGQWKCLLKNNYFLRSRYFLFEILLWF